MASSTSIPASGSTFFSFHSHFHSSSDLNFSINQSLCCRDRAGSPLLTRRRCLLRQRSLHVLSQGYCRTVIIHLSFSSISIRSSTSLISVSFSGILCSFSIPAPSFRAEDVGCGLCLNRCLGFAPSVVHSFIYWFTLLMFQRFGNMAGIFQVMAFGVQALDERDVDPAFMAKLAKIATAELISSKVLCFLFFLLESVASCSSSNNGLNPVTITFCFFTFLV